MHHKGDSLSLRQKINVPMEQPSEIDNVTQTGTGGYFGNCLMRVFLTKWFIIHTHFLIGICTCLNSFDSIFCMHIPVLKIEYLVFFCMRLAPPPPPPPPTHTPNLFRGPVDFSELAPINISLGLMHSVTVAVPVLCAVCVCGDHGYGH